MVNGKALRLPSGEHAGMWLESGVNTLAARLHIRAKLNLIRHQLLVGCKLQLHYCESLTLMGLHICT